MHCLHPQTHGSEGAAAESQAGRLLWPADWSNPRLQRGSGQRAAAQSQHQTVGQTGEHNTAPNFFFLLMDFIDGYKWFWLLPGDEGWAFDIRGKVPLPDGNVTFAYSPQIIIPRRIYWFRTSNKGGAVSYLPTHFYPCLFLDWHPGSGISSHDQLLVLHLSRSGEWSLLTIKKKIGSHVNPVKVKRICAFFCSKISFASMTMSMTLSIYSITRSTTWSLMTRESWS